MPQLTLEQAMQVALTHHQAGRHAEAEHIYRQMLAQAPNHVEAMHHLGMIAHRSGRLDAAAELMSRSIVLRPDVARYHLNYGVLVCDQGKVDQAIASYSQALQLDPNFSPAHFNLGNALAQKGNLHDALASYLRAAQLAPDFIDAHLRLGILYSRLSMLKEAGNAFQQALRIKPDCGDAFTGLTYVLMNLGNQKEAIGLCRRAIALRNNCPDDFNSLGILLHHEEKLDEALAAFSRALELKPAFLEAWNNLGNLLTELQRLDEAYAAYGRAKEIDPAIADPHFNQAWVTLLRGELEQGWRGHEWRWGSKNFSTPRPDLGRPMWDGSLLGGRTILLHAEQGLGDAIQFVRYAPLVARRGGRVIVHCPPELQRLFKTVEGIERIVSGTLPEFDLQCPLMSLPLAFNTSLQTIPADIPYIRADAAAAAAWATKVSLVGEPAAETSPPTRLKVGLAWAGRAEHKLDHKRSIRLEQLAPLKTEGVTFFSLQKGAAGFQAANHSAGIQLIDFTAELDDMAATAALVANLDLVIAVDTAVAHLAGALGKPVWILLPFKPDWRWMLERSDSPWYPTMRIFRQKRPADWAGVVSEVRSALAAGKICHSDLGSEI